MASVYKRTRPRPIPDGAEIINLTAAIIMAAAMVPIGVRLMVSKTE